MGRRLIAAIATIALAVGLTVVATPAHASTTHTLAQTQAKLKGMSAGPNANTYWGQATINGTWTSYVDCHNKLHYVPKLTITNHNPTLTARSQPAPSAPSAICQPGIGARTSNGVMHPDSWYNPASWNWAKIWGSFWDTISKCISGAIHGTVNTLTAQAAVAAVAEGATFEVTAAGVALLAIGGCLSAVDW